METIPRMLQDFKKNLHGCPTQFTTREDGTEDQDLEQGMKKWEAVIDRMIFCFTEINEDTCSMKNEYRGPYFKQLYKPNEGKPVKDWFIPCEETYNGEKYYRLNEGEVEPGLEEKYRQKEKEITEYREHMKDEGLDLFKKYFWNLWD
jgi:hypothetical protein